ncbi:MAG TPA: hypothetical protein VLN08_07470 [Vicinamibacterales bacterium]|nr:hypothetical protein [Vicinamibacterales bacterium]
MTRNVNGEIREWLEAEAAGRAEEADLRFRSISRGLERARVPAGFADAVIARIGAARAAADAYSKRWVRVAVAASVVLVGGVAALVPWHVWMGALLASVQAVAVGVGQVIVGGRAWVSGGLALWSSLADAAAVVGRLLLRPGPIGLLALNLAVAVCAFGALRRLMALQEN